MAVLVATALKKKHLFLSKTHEGKSQSIVKMAWLLTFSKLCFCSWFVLIFSNAITEK
jgi:hypothetical protein